MARTELRKVHLVLDFDGTIVKDSTIPLFDYLRQDEKVVKYSSFLDPYMTNYNDHVKNYRPVKKDRVTLQQEYDYLSSLSTIEKLSIERIERSGWLKGVQWSPKDMSNFDDATKRIRRDRPLQWRSGFADLVNAVWRNGGRVDILSVNWSSNFIRSLILNEFKDRIDFSKIRIYANEIDPLGSGRLSRVQSVEGDEVRLLWPHPGTAEYHRCDGIWTSADKSKIFESINIGSRLEGALSVYVGDSKTDLNCLVEADLGIRILDEDGQSEEQIGLSEVLDRIRIKQKSPTGETLMDSEAINQDQTVWCIKDLSMLCKMLFKT